VKFALAVAMRPADHFLPMAISADTTGWDTIVVPDSVFHPENVSAPYPYTADGQRFWPSDTPFVDPWVAIPAMAAVTKRVRFYSHVLKLAIRNPLLVAKTLSSAAALSGNRVALGAGLGWIPEEFAWCGTEYETRGARMNEALEIIRLCLSGEYVAYQGQHYNFERLRMAPVPTEKVPFLIGGHSKPALRRAAKYGDGWTSAMTHKAELKGFVAELRRLREEYGRAHEPFEISVVCMDAFGVDGYRELAEIGATEVITQPWIFYGAGLNPSLAQAQDGIARFADEIITRFR
jgi:probable F420-dependent oxidoreductase